MRLIEQVNLFGRFVGILSGSETVSPGLCSCGCSVRLARPLAAGVSFLGCNTLHRLSGDLIGVNTPYKTGQLVIKDACLAFFMELGVR
jgi:hypothetical protein